MTASRKFLFLSDAHLGGFSSTENDRLEQALIHLIDYCRQQQIKIYILGDLFDYWMEYPGHIPKLGRRLLNRFREYNRRFGPTLYITGNHDNWTRSHFTKSGFTVKKDYHVLELDGMRLLLLHGDGLLTPDGQIRRPLIHRVLRNENFVRLYQAAFPPKAGLWLMKWFSKINRWMEARNPDRRTLDNWAESLLRETGFDSILCGHDHQPRQKEFGFGTYFNLGTFYKHNTAVLYNNRSIDLVVWNDGERELYNYYTAIA